MITIWFAPVGYDLGDLRQPGKTCTADASKDLDIAMQRINTIIAAPIKMSVEDSL